MGPPQVHGSTSMHAMAGAAEPISVVVAENHQLTLRGIASLFEEEGDIALVAGVASGEEAIEAIRRYQPDVAVFSLDLPDLPGLGLLEHLAQASRKTRIVLLAMRLHEGEFLRAMHLGVHGVVLKEMPAPLLARCVRIVHRGGAFVEKSILLRTFARMVRKTDAQEALEGALTLRERDIVSQVVSGLSNKEVGRRLGLSEGTVKSHLHRVYEKLHVHSRYGLIKLNGETALEQA